jgi:oxygen-independent coproporphyrinogen-3 oxidase
MAETSILAALDEEHLARLDRAAPRYTSYPTAPTWKESFTRADHVEALATAAQRGGPLSLYLHIPFCREMCSYCGCNVVVSRSSERAGRYVDTLAAELQLLGRALAGRRQLARVHLGGGTPTFLTEAQLEQLWGAVLAAGFEVAPGAELAIEVDPAVTRASQIQLLAQLGWNRISLGVQDLDPAVQQAVNRIQSVEETAATVATARAAGFTSVNFDLIYGLPRQRPETWRRTLEQVVAIGPDRLAVYSFAYLPDLRPNQRRLPAADVPTGAAKLELFRIAHEVLSAAGYQAIGMDHFARPDDELARARRERRLWRDFQGFSVRRATDTVAAGASGISTLDEAIVQAPRGIGTWGQAIRAGQLPVERGIRLDADDRRRRDVIVQLMCNDWVDLGADGPSYFERELEALRAYEAEGLCIVDGREVTLTPLGRTFSRLCASVFDTYLRAPADAAARPQFSRTI